MKTKYKLKLLIVATLFLIGIYYILTRDAEEAQIVRTSKNYFLTEAEYNRMGFLINSSVCKIPDINPWDPSVLPFTSKVSPPVNCRETGQHWTYVKNSAIVLNESAIREDGFSSTTIFCCYRTITRNDKLKDLDNHGTYSMVVDSRVIYSSTCTPMGDVTEPTGEFVFVTCEPKYLHWYYGDRVLTSKAVYRNFHALVPKVPSNKIQEKIEFWKKEDSKSGGSKERPPNVIMIGLDAISRLNFRRSMPRTIKILKNLGAHEMLGYTKIGENTWPNFLALHTGFEEYDFRSACYYTRETKLDECPFIWKRFSAANYLTTEIQDAPRRNSWNFEKPGFVEPPTDFYFRPFMVAVHLNEGFYPDRVECIGGNTIEKSVYNYIEDIVDFAKEHRTPVFVNAWLTQLGHDSLNSLQFGDNELSEMLERLTVSGSLDNSILVLVADHGYRYGGIRQTLIGYYEDKLPMLWIRLPQSLSKKLPKWEAALTQNERRLAVAFDLYATYNHVLDTFANSTSEILAKTQSGLEIQRDVGSSMFRPLEFQRSCGEAGIPESYCACNFPIRLSAEDSRIQEAAAAAVNYINNILPTECSRLVLQGVKGGAHLNKLQMSNSEQLLVEFVTSPGDFVLEATVSRSAVGEYTVKKNVQRLSKFQSEVTCITDQKLQLYCHCL